jgi:hypothetical protein
LSLSRAREKGFVVVYDDDKNCFVLKRENEKEIVFEQSPRGLYFYDTAGQQEHGTVFVNTVEHNKSKFSHRDYLRAIEARKLICKIGRPSQATFLRILDHNMLPNCPVTRRDAMNAEIIFGPEVGSLKGKTVRRSGMETHPILNDLPLDVMSRYRDVTLTGDIFFVNKIMFFITRSRHIQFATVETIVNREPDTILKAFTNVRQIYMQRGFNVSHLLVDGEFECLRGAMAGLGVTLNTASHDEHVPDIERYIRTVKERTRSIYNTLPFKKMPDRIIIEMVCACNFWLNSFPPKSGISDTLSPRAIVTGASIDFNRHCQLEFGAYVQTHEEHNNSMATRTVGALALRPTGNDQGGYYFFSLNTGRVLNRNHWTELPMPADVITRIHALARRNPGGMKFSNRDRAAYILDEDYDDSDDDDEDYTPPDDEDNDDSDDDSNDENNDDDDDDDGEYIPPSTDEDEDGESEEYEPPTDDEEDDNGAIINNPPDDPLDGANIVNDTDDDVSLGEEPAAQQDEAIITADNQGDATAGNEYDNRGSQ